MKNVSTATDNLNVLGVLRKSSNILAVYGWLKFSSVGFELDFNNNVSLYFVQEIISGK